MARLASLLSYFYLCAEQKYIRHQIDCNSSDVNVVTDLSCLWAHSNRKASLGHGKSTTAKLSRQPMSLTFVFGRHGRQQPNIHFEIHQGSCFTRWLTCAGKLLLVISVSVTVIHSPSTSEFVHARCKLICRS